jgi:hypothetical protein
VWDFHSSLSNACSSFPQCSSCRIMGRVTESCHRISLIHRPRMEMRPHCKGSLWCIKTCFVVGLFHPLCSAVHNITEGRLLYWGITCYMRTKEGLGVVKPHFHKQMIVGYRQFTFCADSGLRPTLPRAKCLYGYRTLATVHFRCLSFVGRECLSWVTSSILIQDSFLCDFWIHSFFSEPDEHCLCVSCRTVIQFLQLIS